MAFWGRQEVREEELPPEIKGKKPEEIAAEIKRLQALETATVAEKTAREAAEAKATAQATEIDAMRVKMAELEKNQKEPVHVEEEEASPWVDPKKFVADETKGTHAVALNAGLMAAKMYFTSNLSARDQKIHKKYEKEVEQVVGTFAPEARVLPQSWFNAFLYVKGLHEVDIAKAESTNSDFFSEPASRSTTHHDEPPVDKLTPEEEAVCKSMHWNPETYLKNKKAAQLAGHDKGMHATFSVPERNTSNA